MIAGLRWAAALLLLPACGTPSDATRVAERDVSESTRAVADTQAPDPKDVFEGYRLAHPDTVLRLPGVLDEVSGLAWGPNGLEANYDERGETYRLDGTRWVKATSYANKGDFEGIAYAGSSFYALRSDGRLVTPQGFVNLEAPRGCDGEGLAFDARAGRLLVACKGESAATRVILAWDLASRRLLPDPVIAIATNLGQTEGRMARLFHLDRLDRFRPSGIEVGPDGRLWVLSSQTPAVGVFRRDGTLEAAGGLDARILPQPEGLTFGPDETLYIASEAAGRGQATLAVFYKRRPAPGPP